MSRLLSSNFARVRKDKIFWLGLLAALSLPLISCRTRYTEMKEFGFVTQMDDLLFLHVVYLGGICAAFCGLFLGTEYADGTIRNKLMIGHRRGAVYLANLLLVFGATLFIHIVTTAVVYAVGFACFGAPTIDVKGVLRLFALSVLLTAAFSAAFTMLAMLCQNRAMASVTALVLFFALLFTNTVIRSRLKSPEFTSYTEISAEFTSYTEISAAEETVIDLRPNPYYVRGTKRQVFELLMLLPTGQAISIGAAECENPWGMAAGSIIVTALCTVGGLMGFRKKDIK